MGAAAALLCILLVLLIWDAVTPTYEMQTVTLAALLSTIAALLGLEIRDQVGIVRDNRKAAEEEEEEDEKNDDG